jgi:hypothetical protein
MDLRPSGSASSSSCGRCTSCSKGSTSGLACCSRSSRARTRSGARRFGRLDPSGTGTKSGSSWPEPPRSRRSRPGTRRCSRASTSRSCSSCSSSSSASSRSSGARRRDASLAGDVDVGEHDRQLRRGVALRIGLSCLVYGVDQLGRGLHRRPPGSLQRVQRVRRSRGRRAVRIPRRDVSHAAYDG